MNLRVANGGFFIQLIRAFCKCKFSSQKTSSDVTRECNLLEVLQLKKVVTSEMPISTNFSTDCVEEKIKIVTKCVPLLAFLFVPVCDHFKCSWKHGTWAGAVGFADQAVAFHLIEHGGGAAIADT